MCGGSSCAPRDFERHGDMQYGSPHNGAPGLQSLDGKMEKAYLSFRAQHPSWRDDRGALLDTLAVPTQIVRGNFTGAFDPLERTRAALSRLPFPADSFVVPDARACLPYEQPEKTAACLRHFLDSYAPASDGAAPDGVALVPAPEAS